MEILGKFIKGGMYFEQNHLGFLTKSFGRFIESSFSCDFPINQDCKIFYQNCCDFVFTSGLTCLLCDLLALALPVLKSITKYLCHPIHFEKKAFKKGKQISHIEISCFD